MSAHQVVFQFVMRMIFDAHFHGREGAVLNLVTKMLGKVAGYATYMPNLSTPVKYREQVDAYEEAINATAPDTLVPVMTIYLTPQTTPNDILEARHTGARAAKLYPKEEDAGETTTNAGHGISVRMSALKAYHPIFKKMEQVGMLLLLHGEVPWGSSVKREKRFLKILRYLAKRYPQLKIVMEHITTAAGVKAVKKLGPNVAATITVHHMMLTLDDVLGNKLSPHRFCKPIAKRRRDRRALRRAAMSGNPKFFFGSDSAPHLRKDKECDAGCAGVFTTPVMVPLLVDLFRRHNALHRLECFTSTFGCRFYELPLPKERITIAARPWRVPQHYDDIVPFCAGETLPYQVIPSSSHP